MPATAKKQPERAAKRRTARKPLVVTMVAVDAIDPSPVNRRADVALSPLVESVRTYGIQTQIKLRPSGDRFEIVFGDCRAGRAAPGAPCPGGFLRPAHPAHRHAPPSCDERRRGAASNGGGT